MRIAWYWYLWRTNQLVAGLDQERYNFGMPSSAATCICHLSIISGVLSHKAEIRGGFTHFLVESSGKNAKNDGRPYSRSALGRFSRRLGPLLFGSAAPVHVITPQSVSGKKVRSWIFLIACEVTARRSCCVALGKKWCVCASRRPRRFASKPSSFVSCFTSKLICALYATQFHNVGLYQRVSEVWRSGGLLPHL